MLSCDWPLHPGSYDARAFEVERATKRLAWEVWVCGVVNRCAETFACETIQRSPTLGSPPFGWFMYSVERGYAEPLLYGVRCQKENLLDGEGGYAATLSFNTHNVFKQTKLARGTWTATSTSGAAVGSGAFELERYWLRTSVSATLGDDADVQAGASLSVKVANVWGGSKTRQVTCSRA